MASNVTLLRGICPPPFLDGAKFTKSGGNLGGRLCAPVAQLPGKPTCCLPCPATDWIYPDSFQTWYRISESISAVGLVICAFLMLSWAVLPVEKTRRHYLSICLVIGIILEAFAFVIPLGVKPNQCFDEITPNDMYSNLTCAFSGAFIVGGALVVTVWIFIRALSMHLQICWDIVPGNRFFYASQALGWGVAALLFTVTMTLTGVSFRFGDACHVNSTNSMADFWGPLLGIAIAAGLVQTLTFMYCIKVYLRNIWSDDRSDTGNSSGLPSYHSSSLRASSARAVYQRVKKVLWLQWRSITIVIFLLVDIIFLAIVWVQLDNAVISAKEGKLEKFMPFLVCLYTSGGVKDKCFADGQRALVNQGCAIAILMLLSLTGVQTGLMMSRASMFVGWYEFFKDKFGSKREFVSLDAKRFSTDARTFELFKVGSPNSVQTKENVNQPEIFETKEAAHSPPAFGSPNSERAYRKPTMSFSGPSPPSRAENRTDWQAEDTYARGGLSSHPPRSPDDRKQFPPKSG